MDGNQNNPVTPASPATAAVNNGVNVEASVEALQNTIKGLTKQISQKDQLINDLNKKVEETETAFNTFKKGLQDKGYEVENIPSFDEFKKVKQDYTLAQMKLKIAKENNIDIAWVDRLKGNTEEELKKDAENLASLTAGKYSTKTDDPKPAAKKKIEVSGAEAAKGHFAKYRKQ